MRDIDTKIDNTAPSATGRLPAAQFNSSQNELENAVTTAGITLDGSSADTDLYMLAQSQAKYASGGVFGTDTGAINAYVVGAVGSFKPPKALFTGMRILFYPGAGNSGASTLNAFSLGAKALLTHTGAALAGAETVTNRLVEAVYDTTAATGAGGWKLAPWANALLFSGGGGGGGGGWAGWLQPARTVTTANIALSGAQTIDGVSCIAGERVLVNAQSTASQNGVYVVASGAWSRSTDADANGELVPGVCIVVTEGTTYADTLWELTTDGTIVVGSTSLSFAQIRQKPAPALKTLVTGQSSGDSIPTAVFTLLHFGTTRQNTLGTSTWTNSGSRLTIGAGEAGLWALTATVSFLSPVGGSYSAIQILKNGVTPVAFKDSGQGNAADGISPSCAGTAPLVAGDYIEAFAYHQATTSSTYAVGAWGDRSLFSAVLVSQ